jgi:lipopolysaccharide transport system permease protein
VSVHLHFVKKLLPTCLAALGLGLWLAALAVQYRDVAHALPFCLQSLMYLSPVVFPASIVPTRLRWLY